MIDPQKELKKITALEDGIQCLFDLPLEVLTENKSDKKWCVLEIIQHMDLAQDAYTAKIEKALISASDYNKDTLRTGFTSSKMTSLLLKTIQPSNNKIPFKMKTMKKFVPKRNRFYKQDESNLILTEFLNKLAQLKKWIYTYQNKKTEKI